MTFVLYSTKIKNMIAIKQLIEISPFPEDVKKELLEKADSLTDAQKFDLQEKCWSLISADYKNRLNFEIQKRTYEMAKGEKTYSKEDFKKIEDDLFSELGNRLKATENQEEINRIRQQLQSI